MQDFVYDEGSGQWMAVEVPDTPVTQEPPADLVQVAITSDESHPDPGNDPTLVSDPNQSSDTITRNSGGQQLWYGPNGFVSDVYQPGLVSHAWEAIVVNPADPFEQKKVPLASAIDPTDQASRDAAQQENVQNIQNAAKDWVTPGAPISQSTINDWNVGNLARQQDPHNVSKPLPTTGGVKSVPKITYVRTDTPVDNPPMPGIKTLSSQSSWTQYLLPAAIIGGTILLGAYVISGRMQRRPAWEPRRSLT